MNQTKEQNQCKPCADSDHRWPLVVGRDRASDGAFVYAVRTTGVYCRPSCSSRLPRPENVIFYPNGADAEAQGFRPCKRCKPNTDHPEQGRRAAMASICRFIERAEAEPSLKQLARRANMSEFHFHREFKKAVGLTPKQYAAAHRDKSLRKHLSSSRTVTEAIYSSGYSSSSRFYDKSNALLGMKASSYRAGGRETEVRFAVGETSLGHVLVAQTEIGVCAILLGNDPQELVHDLERQFPKSHLLGSDPTLDQRVATVVGMIEMTSSGSDLPLDIRGTAFQQKIWQALRQLPSGSTATYQQIADAVGMPRAVRAVARACAANRLAVAIPCHRVIRSDGGLSGYRWGVERKAALLTRESELTLRHQNGSPVHA